MRRCGIWLGDIVGGGVNAVDIICSNLCQCYWRISGTEIHGGEMWSMRRLKGRRRRRGLMCSSFLGRLYKNKPCSSVKRLSTGKKNDILTR